MRAADRDWSPADATFAHVDLAVMLAVFGLLLTAAGWAAARGRLKRNYAIGMRTGTIMRTDQTWRVAHEKCAWSLWSSGLVLLVTGGALAGFRPPRQWTLALMITMVVYLTIAVLVGFVQADKAARSVD